MTFLACTIIVLGFLAVGHLIYGEIIAPSFLEESHNEARQISTEI